MGLIISLAGCSNSGSSTNGTNGSSNAPSGVEGGVKAPSQGDEPSKSDEASKGGKSSNSNNSSKAEAPKIPTKKSKNSIGIVIDGAPNAYHTGLYVALEKGYFKEEGLKKVEIIQSSTSRAARSVSSGNNQFGIETQINLLDGLGNAGALEVTAVAALSQHDNLGIISVKDAKIKSMSDLMGHKGANVNTGIKERMLQKLVEGDDGVFTKVKLIKDNNKAEADIVEALKKDAEFAWANELTDGTMLKLEKIDYNFIKFSKEDKMLDGYGPLLIANNDYLKNNSDKAKAFLKAVKKGYEYAAKEPEKAAKILLKNVKGLDEDYIMESQKAISEEYISDAKSFGVIDSKRWNTYSGYMNYNQIVTKPVPNDTGFSMKYLK